MKFVEPSKAEMPLKILLYGPSGAGKSTAAASAPGPILYLNADGTNALRFPRRKHGDTKIREVTVTGTQTLVDAVDYLRSPAHGIKTVVLDTVTATHTVLLDEKAGKGARPTLQQYGDVGITIERFCRELRDHPVNVVLLCQEMQLVDEGTGVVERVPSAGTNKTTLSNKLMAMVDVVGLCGRVPAKEGEKSKYVATLVDIPGRRGKDRTDVLGEFRELDLSEWVKVAASK